MACALVTAPPSVGFGLYYPLSVHVYPLVGAAPVMRVGRRDGTSVDVTTTVYRRQVHGKDPPCQMMPRLTPADPGTPDAVEGARPQTSERLEDEPHLSLSWLLAHPLVGAAAVSSAGAGLVHAAAAGTHSTERVAAILFAATGALQVAWAFLYLARPTRRSAVLGLVLNGLFAVMWLASRTIGLPFPEALAGVEHVSLQDTIAALLGLAAAVCAALAARRPERVRDHRAGSIAVASALSVVVVAFAIGGVSATHGHGATGSDHSAMDMSPSSGGDAGMESMSGMDMGAMPGMDMGTGAQTAVGASTDVDFARSTVIRRAQALRMAELALLNSPNGDVAAHAYFIQASSPPEVDRMMEALRAANHEVPDLTSVSTGSLAAPFAGSLLTEADFAKLENAYGSTLTVCSSRCSNATTTVR